MKHKTYYYYCQIIPYENTDITVYDTLEELIKENKIHMRIIKDWYIIKGKEIDMKEIDQ